jgi:signal transduction histidine kinase
MNEIGLGAAISEWIEDQVEQRHDILTEFRDTTENDTLKNMDENVRALLFRNVRELLNNMVKHARAKQVCVSMAYEENVLKLVIEDDGIGFDPVAVFQSDYDKDHFGLFSVRERMSDLGGRLRIDSQPGEGCKAILTLPLGIK